jgi:hypothetical protein
MPSYFIVFSLFPSVNLASFAIPVESIAIFASSGSNNSCATRYGASKQPCLKPKKSGVRTHQRRMTGMAIQWWTRAPRVSGQLLKDSKGKLPSKSISALAK